MLSQNANRASSFSQTTTLQGPEIVAANWKSFLKNTLQGFVDLTLPEVGLTIHGVCVHQKNGQRWVSLPSKPWVDSEGVTKWQSFLDFVDSDHKAAFQAAAIAAVDELRGR